MRRRAAHSATRERDELFAARAPPRASSGSRPIARERGFRALARREAVERERVRERLSPVRERGLDDALDGRPVRRAARVRLNATSAESTFGRGRKTLRAHRMPAGALGRELHEHRDRAVRLRARRREEAVGDLALHHHAPVARRSAARRGSRRRSASRRCTGRFATSLRGAGSSAARSSASASPQCSSTFGRQRVGSSARASGRSRPRARARRARRGSA